MDIINYSCPNCGGKLVFNPEKQLFSCEWCFSDFTQENINEIFGSGTTPVEPINDGTANADDQQSFENGTDLYVCDSCGAEIIAESNTAASFCYYCHSPVALKGRLSGKYCPQKVIPFKKSKDQAIEGFKEWCGKKWFLPSGFTSEATLEKITGLYVPFWLADCKVDAHLSAEGKIIHRHNRGNTTVVKTQHFAVERDVSMNYVGVPADGSKKLDDQLMDSIEPFDYNDLTDFSMSYLQGFYADKYDVEKTDVLPRIKERITDGAVQMMLDDIKGYTTVTPLVKNVNILKTDWHYMLLPVWFLSYDYRGKKYFYAMNGQTGKFSGIMPLSPGKVAVAAIITAIVFGIGGLLLGGALYA